MSSKVGFRSGFEKFILTTDPHHYYFIFKRREGAVRIFKIGTYVKY
jgi:hypothetical protein